MHVRQQIRAAVAAAVTGLATTGTRVFASRVYPVAEGELPCLLITTGDEQAETANLAWRSAQRRELGIEVVALAQAASGVENTLDTIAEEVETALYATQSASTLAGLLLHPLRLDGIEVDLDGDGQRPTGALTLRLTATYETDAGVPGTAL
jgi:Zn-dependent M28 family amino/carboxypeptidase